MKLFYSMLTALALCGPAHAATYTFDLLATSGNSGGENFVGPNLTPGDTVTLNVRTAADKAFYNESGDYVWASVNLNQGATRTADYAWSFFNDGVLVHSSAAADRATSQNHLGVFTSPAGFQGLWDYMTWTGLFESSTSGNANSVFSLTLLTNGSLVDVPPLSAVPLPAAIWMFGSALVGMLGLSRRRKDTLSAA